MPSQESNTESESDTESANTESKSEPDTESDSEPDTESQSVEVDLLHSEICCLQDSFTPLAAQVSA